jgi:hypothetical protein
LHFTMGIMLVLNAKIVRNDFQDELVSGVNRV